MGAHFADCDSFLILSHFKGHAMGGFGGVIKNTSIGIASGEGKMWIHTDGLTRSLENFELCFKTDQDHFLKSMAEAAGAVIDRLGRACVDLMYAADKKKSVALRKRIEDKHGVHTLDHAEALGIGRQQYTLEGIDA